MQINSVYTILGKNKILVSIFLFFILVPIIVYLYVSIFVFKWKFDLNIFIALYYGIFAVVLGSLVFINVKELKISTNNEEFMNILNEIINDAKKEIVIVCPNVNIGQTIVPIKFAEYHLNIKKKIDAKINKPTIIFYCKKYTPAHSDKIEEIKKKDDFVSKTYSEDTMFKFIQNSFKDSTNINDSNIQENLKELKHFLIDLCECEFKELDNKIWESNIFMTIGLTQHR